MKKAKFSMSAGLTAILLAGTQLLGCRSNAWSIQRVRPPFGGLIVVAYVFILAFALLWMIFEYVRAFGEYPRGRVRQVPGNTGRYLLVVVALYLLALHFSSPLLCRD
ncbi:conserved protein of unknown function [Pararobbsia alpina]|uniref:hypothetical protein n=1 Tax=Pararobbsia alpina TaxID=621374 RepID=UPI0039A4B992